MVGENTWINVSPHLSTNLSIEIFIGISIVYLPISSQIHMVWSKRVSEILKKILLENAKCRLEIYLLILLNYLSNTNLIWLTFSTPLSLRGYESDSSAWSKFTWRQIWHHCLKKIHVKTNLAPLLEVNSRENESGTTTWGRLTWWKRMWHHCLK